MSFRPAPRAALWLLERLAGHMRFEALIGDLAEQFAAGRSRLWFWRQAMAAIAIHLLHVLRIHGPSFVAAVLVGCALNAMLEQCCTLAFQPVYQNLPAVKLHPWSGEALLRLAGMMANTGYWCALCSVAAWAVTLIHGAHQRAALVTFICIQTALSLPGIMRLALQASTGTHPLIPLATQIILTGQHAAFLLAAGLWVIRTRLPVQPGRWARITGFLWIGQIFLAALLFSARRVGELSYSRPEGYLSLYALTIAGGAYLAFLLWRPAVMKSEADT